MDKKTSGLADRLRAAIEDQEAERERVAQARERRRSEGREARDALLADLETFAGAVGHVGAQRHEDGLVLVWQGRTLRFDAVGEGDRVRVAWDGTTHEEHTISREADLADRWVLESRHRGRVDKVPLFDKGLEELLVNALGLPRVTGPEDERPMSRRTAEALLRPQVDERPSSATPSAVRRAPSAEDEPSAVRHPPSAEDETEEAPKGPEGKTRRL